MKNVQTTIVNTVTGVLSRVKFHRRQKPFVPGVWVEPYFHLDPMLLNMCAGDESAARALVRMHMGDGQSVQWATQKAIVQLERDRR